MPSSKYRIQQLIPYYSDNNIFINQINSKSGAYPVENKFRRIPWAFRNITENFIKVLNQPKSDINFVQREFLSKFKTFESFINKPNVFDIDDAVFLYGNHISKIVRDFNYVTCGNNYIANYVSRYNTNIEVIPTSVNVEKYFQIPKKYNGEDISILWTGSSSGYKYLYSIEDSLNLILHKHKNVKLKIISDMPPCSRFLANGGYSYTKWTPLIEYSSIKDADIGLMPLFDDDWSKGKCSFKMLTYMAAAKPVVVSPFGMNDEVLQMGDFGFGARSINDWYESIDYLIENHHAREFLGINGYNVVKSNFDIDIIGSKYIDVFSKLIT